MDEALLAGILEDHTDPGLAIEDGLRATLTVLEVFTLRPSDLSAEHIAATRAAGVSDDALREALQVAFVFNIVDRLADAFDFPLMTPEQYVSGAKFVDKKGYAL